LWQGVRVATVGEQTHSIVIAHIPSRSRCGWSSLVAAPGPRWGNIGPWPDHCGFRRKTGRALQGSFIPQDVFHRFIAVAPLKIHSGPLQSGPERGGMLWPGGAGPRPERSIRPRLFRAPAGRHQSSDDGRPLAGVGYKAGDRIVPSRWAGPGASGLVRARAHDEPVLCDRHLRALARHLEKKARTGGVGDASKASTGSVGGAYGHAVS